MPRSPSTTRSSTRWRWPWRPAPRPVPVRWATLPIRCRSPRQRLRLPGPRSSPPHPLPPRRPRAIRAVLSWRLPLFALWVAAALAGCGRFGERPAKGKEAPRPVALVNGEPISREVVRRELIHARAAGAEGDAPDSALRRRLLDDLVDRALLLQQARARSIAVGQDQVE